MKVAAAAFAGGALIVLGLSMLDVEAPSLVFIIIAITTTQVGAVVLAFAITAAIRKAKK